MKKIIVSVLIIIFVVLGFYFKSYKPKENNDNRELFDKYLSDYEYKINQEEESLNSKITDIEKEKDGFKENLVNERITFIGDSVMLGAESDLKSKFKNAYVDAAVSRTAWVLGSAVDEAKSKGKLGEIVVINLGANGDCSLSCKKEVLNKLKNKKVFWINTTNYDYVNERLISLEKEYNNLWIIDWKKISKSHSEYFVSDGIHLTNAGRKAFTNAIYESIYEVFAKEYDDAIQDLKDEFNKTLASKISFYGDETLLNNFKELYSKFPEERFYNVAYKDLKNKLMTDIDSESISKRIVLVYNNEDFSEITKLLKDYEVYRYSGDIDKLISELSN